MIAAEIVSQRRVTEGMLRADGRMISLTRSERHKNDRGGVGEDSPHDIDPQLFKIIHDRAVRNVNTVESTSGEVPRARDQLMGRHDADIKIGDTFELDDKKYRVVYVHPHADYWYETLANLGMNESA